MRGGGFACHAFRLAGLAVAAVSAMLLLSAGETQACSKGDHAIQQNSAIVAHTPASAAEFAASAAAAAPVVDRAVHCCGVCSGTATCTSGHCPTCAPALPAFDAAVVLQDISSIHAFLLQAGMRPRTPPPELRPPRSSI
jgi:hypothetical protein